MNDETEAIRRKMVEQHRRAMLTATLFAALFLVVYVSRAVLFETKLFAGEGLVRVVYLTILISHTILAIAVGPLVIVVGSEDAGLSRLVAETCDQLVSIPMAGHLESLNAGVAASVALYAVQQARA